MTFVKVLNQTNWLTQQYETRLYYYRDGFGWLCIGKSSF